MMKTISIPHDQLHQQAPRKRNRLYIEPKLQCCIKRDHSQQHNPSRSYVSTLSSDMVHANKRRRISRHLPLHKFSNGGIEMITRSNLQDSLQHIGMTTHQFEKNEEFLSAILGSRICADCCSLLRIRNQLYRTRERELVMEDMKTETNGDASSITTSDAAVTAYTASEHVPTDDATRNIPTYTTSESEVRSDETCCSSTMSVSSSMSEPSSSSPAFSQHYTPMEKEEEENEIIDASDEANDTQQEQQQPDQNHMFHPTSSIPSILAHVDNLNLDITLEDLNRTREGEMLNDNLVDFGISEIMVKLKAFEAQYHIANSQFYPILKKDVNRCATRVNKTIKIFEKKVICIPVCKDMHWVLVMIFHPDQLFSEKEEQQEQQLQKSTHIMYCDSLRMPIDGELITQVAHYLVLRYNFEKGTSHPFSDLNSNAVEVSCATLPIQPNDVDCAVYCLEYMNKVLSKFLSPKNKTLKLPVKAPKLFPNKRIQKLRKKMRKTILNLAVTQGKLNAVHAQYLQQELDNYVPPPPAPFQW